MKGAAIVVLLALACTPKKTPWVDLGLDRELYEWVIDGGYVVGKSGGCSYFGRANADGCSLWLGAEESSAALDGGLIVTRHTDAVVSIRCPDEREICGRVMTCTCALR